MGELSTYVDRQGKSITPAQWKWLLSMPNYPVIRHYQSEWHDVQVLWNGELPEPFTFLVARHFHKDGNDVTGCETEQGAINLYEDHLARHCGCEWLPSSTSPSGVRLLEIGNLVVATPTQDTADAKLLVDGLECHNEFGTW